MSASELIEQFKALPPKERAQVAEFVVENDDSWIPESFKQGMADAETGRFADMDTVLSGAKPPPRAAEWNTASSRLSGFGKASTHCRQVRKIPLAGHGKSSKKTLFDARPRSHKIHKLSARYRRTIYAVEIEVDVRAVFYVEGDMVVTVDIGSHDLYRG
jgi:hypothetical protein